MVWHSDMCKLVFVEVVAILQFALLTSVSMATVPNILTAYFWQQHLQSEIKNKLTCAYFSFYGHFSNYFIA